MNRLADWDSALSGRLALPQTDPKWRVAARIAHLGDGNLVFGALAVAYWWGWQFNRPALRSAVFAVLLSLLAAFLVVVGIKYTLRRQRPRDPTGFISIKFDKYSFPSGHSARMSTLAVAVLLFNWPLGLGLAALALVVAAARVAIGIHYLGDVLVGLAIGGGVAAAVGMLLP
ncbi:MAG: phosphatase PAP2 family protein [Anaerolineae bacterium]